MATPTPTNGVWYYRVNMTIANQQCMFGTFMRNNGSPATTDYGAFCLDFLNGQELPSGILTATRNLIPASVTITKHSIQAVNPARLVEISRAPGVAGAGLPGLRTGTSLPVNTSVAVQRYTVDGTRHGYGTLKPPFGVVEDMQSRGTWLPSFLTDVGAWALKMISAFSGVNTGNQLLPVIWSSAPGFPTIDFLNYLVKSTIRVNRRRTVGVGI